MHKLHGSMPIAIAKVPLEILVYHCASATQLDNSIWSSTVEA